MNWYFIGCLIIVLLVFSAGVELNRRTHDFDAAFGYRSIRSRRNEDTWLEANTYAGRCLMLCATLMFVVLFILEMILPGNHYLLEIMLVFAVICIVTTIALTEQHLSQVFFKDGKRRPNGL